MQFNIERVKNMPYAGKVGVTLWAVSWIWMISTYYYLTHDDNWTMKLAVAALILCVFLLQGQNWARMISVLANVMGIFLSGYFFIAGFSLIATVDVMLFGGAIGFLMLPSTSQYFKSQNQRQSQAGKQTP